jgi:hypothetical protein
LAGSALCGFAGGSMGWRWIFFVNLVVALAGAVMAWKVIQESVAAKWTYGIDLAGTTTLLLFMVSLILGLNREARHSFDSWTGGLFLLFVLFLGLFIFLNSGRRTRSWI